MDITDLLNSSPGTTGLSPTTEKNPEILTWGRTRWDAYSSGISSPGTSPQLKPMLRSPERHHQSNGTLVDLNAQILYLQHQRHQQEQRESSIWSSQDRTVSSASQDDFQQFLDMGIPNSGDLNFDFQDFSGQRSENFNGQMTHHNAGTPERHPQKNDSLVEMDAQIRYLQQQRQRQRQPQIQEQQQTYYANKKTVPPTPDSTEMHGTRQTYSAADVQNTYERHQSRIKEQEVRYEYPISTGLY
jgi:hypothetical protein